MKRQHALGNSTRRDDAALGAILAGFDIVVVQELVSPPYPGSFPDGSPFNPDPQSREFFDVMVSLGFEFLMSPEDTGTGDKIHKNGSATEWWVTFFNPDRVQLADDLPGGFLAEDRSNHDDYERVPFAFGFRTFDRSMDFVLVNVHLMPGKSRKNKERRAHELKAIGEWIETQRRDEQDFIVVGDMNIEDVEELTAATPPGLISLNDQAVPTNTNVNGPKPYDHAMLNLVVTDEVDLEFGFQVADLLDVMDSLWNLEERYPGKLYHHNRFRAYFSDHHPIVFHMNFPEQDDDGI